MQKLFTQLNKLPLTILTALALSGCTLGYSSKIAWEHETHLRWIEKQNPIENIITVVF